MGMGQGFIELGVDVAIFRIRHDDVEVLLQAFDHFRRDAAEGEDGLFHGAGLVRAERMLSKLQYQLASCSLKAVPIAF
jgi:hypothetical protein